MKKKLHLFVFTCFLLFLTSCSDEDNCSKDSALISSISVSSNLTSINVGGSIVLSSKGNDNIDLTENSIFHVNGTPIVGKTYTALAVGTLEIYATYINSEGATLTSPTILVNVNANSNSVINFNKRLLIEDFTGVWCQFCPRIAHAIDLVKEQTSDVVIVAIHGGPVELNPYSHTSEVSWQISELMGQIGFSGWPQGMLNRNTEWAYPETTSESINQAVSLTNGENPNLGLAMETTTNGGNSTVKVKVKFGKNFSDLKLVVYALEDNLIHDQVNATGYYGGADPIVNFEHDHVFRGILSSSIFGETITGSTNFNDEYSKSFTFAIPQNVNSNNVRFVAFVIDSTNKALNSREVGPNESQSFEIE